MKLVLSSMIQKILNWGKIHRVLSLIICLIFFNYCINAIKQAHNVLLYGNYKLVAKIPMEKNSHSGLKPIAQVAPIKVDNDNIVFLYAQNNRPYILSNFNLKTKKFTKFNSTINTEHYIHFINFIDDKIYFAYDEMNCNQDYTCNIKYTFASFDYKKDKIEKINTYKAKYGTPEIKIKLNGQNLILFAKRNEREMFNKKVENKNNKFIPPHEPSIPKSVYNFILYNPKNNVFKEILNFEVNTNNMFAQLENGNILSHHKNRHTHIIDIIDLEKKKISSTPLDFKASLPTFIWVGDNKFIVIYELAYKLKINTYKVTNKNKIKKISSKEVKNHGLFNTFTEFAPRSNIVLNPETIIFVSGFNGKIGWADYTKTTHMYNPKTNKLKKITDFPYKTDGMGFMVLDNSSFLTYGANKCTWVFGCRDNNNNNIYKFKLK